MTEPPPAERFTLLVVDDDDTREVLAELLQGEGFDVLTARDGEEALRHLERRTVDLVLLDVVMPGTNGLEVLTNLRARHSATELPVIMMSAKDHSDDVVSALSQGANDYVTKPLDLPVLLARVQAQLRIHSSSPARRGGHERGGSLKVGALLDGRYLLEEKLGTGNFGVVYRSLDRQTGETVAVKVLRQVLSDSQEALERLERESRACQRLQSPHAVRVLDFRVGDDTPPYMVMEYLEGRSLDAELREKGRLPPARCGAIVLPICEVLTAAHAEGIVHRDIKPANVFLQRLDGGELVKLLDFGIAKPVGDAVMEKNLTIEGSILGSPAYLAPERLRNLPYDGRADVYSLGVMLFEMLTGRLPFQASDADPMAVISMHLADEPPRPRQWNPDLSPEVEAVVLAALVKDRDQRPQAPQLGQRLAAALGIQLPQGLTP
ncbi:MAG TPA: protein kinase, partial [Thermoanaerobaculia bacterium]|nr:protein kinase [Thermoanaerobaculia bacterium]